MLRDLAFCVCCMRHQLQFKTTAYFERCEVVASHNNYVRISI
uniref:Uncharacterized protein n=1 Tax=Arundo donax TaxID=35708 RepID=A0A0A9GKZ7_ARUDO